MRPSLLLSSLAVLATASAMPLSLLVGKGNGTLFLTTEQLLEIAPNAKTCDGGDFAEECATAEQAVPHIVSSFIRYGVTSRAEQAALISLMALESGEFKYNRNHFPPPGNPGQGTRNMQSPDFNKQYAASIPGLHIENPEDPDSVLDALVACPELDFGSAAWFLTTQCSEEIRSGLQTGSQAGWEKYLTDCIGTTVTDDRKTYWERAIKTLNVQQTS